MLKLFYDQKRKYSVRGGKVGPCLGVVVGCVTINSEILRKSVDFVLHIKVFCAGLVEAKYA